MAKISISEAARRWKVSRSTIQRKLRSGELSASQRDASSANSPKTIDISELIRVFGEPSIQNDTSIDTAPEVNVIQSSDTALIEQLRQENGRLARENERLAAQNDKLIEQIGNRDQFEQKLLEDQRKKRRWWHK